MKIEVSDKLSDFEDMWPTLNQAGDCRFFAFQARDALEVWLRTIGQARRVQPIFVRISKVDGTPLMLLPLGIERRHGLKFLGFLDGGVVDYNAPVLFPGAEAIDAATMRELWRGILSKLPGFDVAVLEKIPATIHELQNPFQFVAPTRDRDAGHLIDLSQIEQDGTGKLKAFRFRDTSRKRKKLKAVAETELKIACTPQELKYFFDVFIKQKSRRYIETRGVDGFDRPGYRSYYWSMVERFSASGNVQVCALLANDVPIASHWGILTSDHFYSLMPAFEAGDWAKYSPGMIHLEEMIQWSVDQGLKIFDLGVGDEPYKLRIENKQLPLFRTEQAATALGRIYLLYLASRRKLASGSLGNAVRGYREWRTSRAA